MVPQKLHMKDITDTDKISVSKRFREAETEIHQLRKVLEI